MPETTLEWVESGARIWDAKVSVAEGALEFRIIDLGSQFMLTVNLDRAPERGHYGLRSGDEYIRYHRSQHHTLDAAKQHADRLTRLRAHLDRIC